MDDPQKKMENAILCGIEDEGDVFSDARLRQLAALIAEGADPSAMTIPLWRGGGGGNTSALILAAARDWGAVVSLFLLDEGLDVDAVDVDGENAFFAALHAGHSAPARLLFERSDMSMSDGEGRSCLLAAIGSGLADEAMMIIERMDDAERQEELKAMRERMLAGGGVIAHDLEARMAALLLSKIEQAALAGASEGASTGRRSGVGRARSL